MFDITRTVKHYIHVTKEQQEFAKDLIDLYFNSDTNFIDNKEDFFYFVEAIADEEDEFCRCGGEVAFTYKEEEEDE